jgi:hypothetical protein
MECKESPDGKHCYHVIPITPFHVGDDEICCHCGHERPRVYRQHGRFAPKALPYYDNIACGGDWGDYDVA